MIEKSCATDTRLTFRNALGYSLLVARSCWVGLVVYSAILVSVYLGFQSYMLSETGAELAELHDGLALVVCFLTFYLYFLTPDLGEFEGLMCILPCPPGYACSLRFCRSGIVGFLAVTIPACCTLIVSGFPPRYVYWVLLVWLAFQGVRPLLAGVMGVTRIIAEPLKMVWLHMGVFAIFCFAPLVFLLFAPRVVCRPPFAFGEPGCATVALVGFGVAVSVGIGEVLRRVPSIPQRPAEKGRGGAKREARLLARSMFSDQPPGRAVPYVFLTPFSAILALETLAALLMWGLEMSIEAVFLVLFVVSLIWPIVTSGTPLKMGFHIRQWQTYPAKASSVVGMMVGGSGIVVVVLVIMMLLGGVQASVWKILVLCPTNKV